jgi:hypothetical protein
VTLAVRGHIVAAGSLLCARRFLLHVKKLRFKNDRSIFYACCVGIDGRALK